MSTNCASGVERGDADVDGESQAAVLERALGLVLFGGTLQGPELPSGLVPRPELVARLRNPRDAAVVVLVAPAGYGKTTLLTQWASEDERPFAWLSVSRGDNDATVLLAYIALALNALEPLDERAFVGLSMSGADLTSVLLPRLGDAMAGRSRPVRVGARRRAPVEPRRAHVCAGRSSPITCRPGASSCWRGAAIRRCHLPAAAPAGACCASAPSI